MFGANVKFNEITFNFITLKQKPFLQYLNSICFNDLKHAINYMYFIISITNDTPPNLINIQGHELEGHSLFMV